MICSILIFYESRMLGNVNRTQKSTVNTIGYVMFLFDNTSCDKQYVWKLNKNLKKEKKEKKKKEFFGYEHEIIWINFLTANDNMYVPVI